MTLLIAALVLSASGCSNENEMSSPEGTVKGYYRALNQLKSKKLLTYVDPSKVSEAERQAVYRVFRTWRKSERKSGIKITLMDIKTTLVSKKENVVWKGDKWYRVKNENATVEVSYKKNGENKQRTKKLVLLDNKWYITHAWE